MEATPHSNVPRSSGKPSEKSEGCYSSKGGDQLHINAHDFGMRCDWLWGLLLGPVWGLLLGPAWGLLLGPALDLLLGPAWGLLLGPTVRPEKLLL